MEIHVSSEEMDVAKDLARGIQPTFWISWRINGNCYPDAKWIDFGTVLLNWWIQVCEQLGDGAMFGTFMFMDGPYEIVAMRSKGGMIALRPNGAYDDGRTEWTVTLLDLVNALSAAIAKCIVCLEPYSAAAFHVAMLRSDETALANVRATVSP